MNPTTGILEDAADCFISARQSLIEGAEYLYKISNENLYVGRYSSFGEFCEQACQITPSFASKLIRNYSFYIVEGGMESKDLDKIDYEKLYLAIGMSGSLSDKVAKATTLSRSELKQELASKDGVDCTHDCEHITICSKCHARIRISDL